MEWVSTLEEWELPYPSLNCQINFNIARVPRQTSFFKHCTSSEANYLFYTTRARSTCTLIIWIKIVAYTKLLAMKWVVGVAFLLLKCLCTENINKIQLIGIVCVISIILCNRSKFLSMCVNSIYRHCVCNINNIV